MFKFAPIEHIQVEMTKDKKEKKERSRPPVTEDEHGNELPKQKESQNMQVDSSTKRPSPERDPENKKKAKEDKTDEALLAEWDKLKEMKFDEKEIDKESEQTTPRSSAAAQAAAKAKIAAYEEQIKASTNKEPKASAVATSGSSSSKKALPPVPAFREPEPSESSSSEDERPKTPEFANQQLRNLATDVKNLSTVVDKIRIDMKRGLSSEEDAKTLDYLKTESEAMRNDFNSLKHVVSKVAQNQIEEAQLQSGTRVCILKSKNIKMKEYYAHWSAFQTAMESSQHVVRVNSNGPLWVVELNMPKNLKSVADRVEAWVRDMLPKDSVAVFKGKHALANLNERVIQACLTILNRILQIEKPEKGKGKGKDTEGQLQVFWFDPYERFKIKWKGQLVVAGKANWKTYHYDLYANLDQLKPVEWGSFCADIVEFEGKDRTGLLMRPKMNMAQNPEEFAEWGKPPKSARRDNNK